MDAIINFMKNIGFIKAILIIGTLLASTIFFIFLIVRNQEPEMGILFSQIDANDGGKIIERLRSMNIPLEVRGEGNQILVPIDQIAKLRMELASDGLPAGGTIGYEIFDKTDVLGTTHALMDINFLRATEGELAKSIRTIQGVQSARVHLVIPKRELFSQEKSSPSASIILKMKGNSRLSVNQVLSIQHLIASATPNLTLDKISIIDDKGTLLAKGQDKAGFGGDSTVGQQETRQAFESKLSRSIESLLEKTLGPDRARAEISVDLDFDKITSTSVEFNPDGQVARSIQNSSEGSNGNEASAADAVTAQNALPDQGTSAGSGNQSKNQATRSDENTSFEISNTTRTHIRESGTIKRLSIAVLIDGTYQKGADGKNQYTARTPEEITQITDLVKTAVGFKDDRGDTIKVVNMRFNEITEIEEKIDFVTKIVDVVFKPKILELLLLISAGMFVFFGLVKPVIFKISGLDIKFAKKNEINNLLQNVEQIYNKSGGGAGGSSSQHSNSSNNGINNRSNNNNNGNNGSNNNNDGDDDGDDDDDDEIKKYKIKKFKGLGEMINIENIDGQINMSSIKKISEVIEKHPEEAIAIIRNWIHSE